MPTVEATLQDRDKRYGGFENNARIAQELKDILKSGVNWAAVSPDKREALEMCASKMARIVNGDPEYPDNWHDIGGYAKLAENGCRIQKAGKMCGGCP